MACYQFHLEIKGKMRMRACGSFQHSCFPLTAALLVDAQL